MVGERKSSERLDRISNSQLNDDFSRGLDHVTEMAKSLLLDIRQNQLNYATMSVHVQNFGEQLKLLQADMRVREAVSVQSQLQMNSLLQDFNLLKTKVDEKLKEDLQAKATDKASRTQTIAALIASAGGIVVAIISLVATFIK